MFLSLSIVLFLVFAVNVGLGSFGGIPFLGDIGEMLLLFSTTIAFVVAILQREASAQSGKSNQDQTK